MPDASEIRTLLREHYDRDSWQQLLHSLFPNESFRLLKTPQALEATHEKVSSTLQLGTLTLPGDDESIAILEVTTTNQVHLARNRVSLRNFVASFIDQAQASAVLAVFRQPDSPDWRLTFASKKTTLDQDTFQITTVETAPRRFTFLLGKNEPCRTASQRLNKLQEKPKDLTLRHLENAFSVESLTKDFFKKYKEHYLTFVSHLFNQENADHTRELFEITEIDPDFEKGKPNKPVRDFVKTLLGRLVFLHFLQKKGWLGCPSENEDWKGGDPQFVSSLLTLAKKNDHADHFLSRYLNELFFNALNHDSKKRVFKPTGTRVPFLNGGLFEKDSEASLEIDFPASLFENLLNFFGEYNFTIDENDPEDHEVGIDPEMLGMIFENLLEDNKEKGTYYTPKAIVSYMARQSLLHYLQTHLGKEEELETLLNEKDPANHPKGSFVYQNAKAIAVLLEKIKICDPAIGSGAFPIGLLHEILWTRLTLNWELNTSEERAKLKEQIIQKSIHGVDLDPGAVEIARLRFWLALIVDEDEPRPLPNLDYKIMQGNSLLESYHGVDLSNVLDDSSSPEHSITTVITGQSEFDLPDSKQEELRVKSTEQKNELLEARRAFFAARKPERKVALRKIIDQKIIEHVEHHLAYQLDAEETQAHRIQTEWQEKQKTAPKWTPAKAAEKRHDTLLKHIETLKDAIDKLGELRLTNDRPFFLWRLLFQDVFQDGGFDIIIANPPYVRQELIKEQKPLLQQEGYECYTGTSDLFVYFYEQAHKLLKPSGTLTFITSNKYYRAGYGKKLRQFLAGKQTIHTLIDFRDAPVFNEVIAYASIYIGQKQEPASEHKVEALPWDLSKPATALPQEIKTAFSVTQDSLTEDGWRLVSPETQSLYLKIKTFSTPLKDVCQGRVYRGITTGYNKAFEISDEQRANLINEDPSSTKLIKPLIRGRNLSRWNSKPENQWLIFTKRGTNIEDYPAIHRHLNDYKKFLQPKPADWPENKKWSGRKPGSYEWFEIQDNIAYWREFEKPKIVSTKVSSKPTFAFDSSKTFLANTAYSFVIDSSQRFIEAILNSVLFNFYSIFAFVEKEGGFFEIQPVALETFPIPEASPTEKKRLTILAEQCAEATNKDDQASLAAYEAEINQIVYRLFDLTEAEIQLIESTLGVSSAIKVPASNSGEVYPPALKKTVWSILKNESSQHPYISLQSLKDRLEEKKIKIADKTLRSYLSEAMSEGLVHNAGRGWYSSLSKPAQLDPSHIDPLQSQLKTRFPFLPHYLWSTLQLNPWMHHLFGKPIHFLHVESDGATDMEDYLRSEGWDVHLNPTAKTASKIIPGPKCLVIRSVRREIDPDREPTVATILTEAFLENTKLRFMDESERKDMSLKLLSEQRIDLAALLSRLTEHKRTTQDLFGKGISGIISEL